MAACDHAGSYLLLVESRAGAWLWGREFLGRSPSGVPFETGRTSHLLGPFFLQHLQEQLDLDLSPLEYMMKCYPEIKEKEEMRKIIGRYGLTGKQQVSAGLWGEDAPRTGDRQVARGHRCPESLLFCF